MDPGIQGWFYGTGAPRAENILGWSVRRPRGSALSAGHDASTMMLAGQALSRESQPIGPATNSQLSCLRQVPFCTMFSDKGGISIIFPSKLLILFFCQKQVRVKQLRHHFRPHHAKPRRSRSLQDMLLLTDFSVSFLYIYYSSI